MTPDQELKETLGWLRFIVISELLPENRIAALQCEARELAKILGRSIVTAKAKGTSRREPAALNLA